MPDDALRLQLAAFIRSSHAHATFDQVMDGFPVSRAGVRPPGMAHSAWELLEHLRLAQNDILRFSRSADYQWPKWPDDYWPKSPAPDSPARWKESVRKFHEDLDAFEALLRDPARDLYAVFPWADDGQTLLREALLIADHNAWHLGQLMLVRRALEG
jgi:hypothetical protein